MAGDSSYDNDMSILPFAHDWKHGFHDVHVGEEVDLENLIH